MYYLVGNLTVADVDGFIEAAKAWGQENHYGQADQNEWGLAEQNIYRSVDENTVIIVNGYKTVEGAQNHKADIESPELKAGHEQMGVKSMDIWITERRVAL